LALIFQDGLISKFERQYRFQVFFLYPSAT
jgi:hypothetical protein